MNKRGIHKKGQLKLSFGMIFSIILIVVFIAFAFYAIKKFLGLQYEIEIEQFVENLQADVDNMWKSSQGSYEAEYSLPRQIDGICFVKDYEDYENLIFESEKIIPGRKIQHIDIDKTLDIAPGHSACFENVDGKVRMVLEKDFEDVLVTISRV